MKKLSVICLALILIINVSFGQSYFDKNSKCSEILKGIPIGDSIFWTKLAARDSCLIGLQTPSFEVKTLDNKYYNIDSLKGQVVFLNFWFTRCVPCKEEMPLLNKLVAEHAKDNVTFLSFANEDSLTVKNFLKKTKFDFEVVPNASRILIDTFKLFSAWPTNIIIDKQGKIQFIQFGKLDDERSNYKKILEESLK